MLFSTVLSLLLLGQGLSDVTMASSARLPPAVISSDGNYLFTYWGIGRKHLKNGENCGVEDFNVALLRATGTDPSVYARTTSQGLRSLSDSEAFSRPDHPRFFADARGKDRALTVSEPVPLLPSRSKYIVVAEIHFESR